MLVTSYMVAYNCENLISKAIESVQVFSDEIVIAIDKKTSDKTRDIIKSYGIANTFEFQFSNFIDLCKEIIPQCHGDWIFGIDTDETLDKSNALLIRDILTSTSKEIDMYYFPRHNWLNWEMTDEWKIFYPDYQYRLCRNTSDLYVPRKVHAPIMGWKNGKQIPHNIFLNHFALCKPVKQRQEIYTAYQKIIAGG